MKRRALALGAVEWIIVVVAGFTLLVTMTNALAAIFLACLFGLLLFVSGERGRCELLAEQAEARSELEIDH